MDGIYQRIFVGVGDAAELRSAIAMAVRELRRAMEKDDNTAVTMAHMRNLDDIDGVSLARAYEIAEKTCIYWPAPGQIREFAGCSDGDKSAEALEWIFKYIERHGIEGRPRGGAAIFGVDPTGRRARLSMDPLVEAPEIPEQIKSVLTALGNGSIRCGLLYVSQHPRLKGWEGGWQETGGDAPSKAAERIERQWMRCCRQASREQASSEPISGRTH